MGEKKNMHKMKFILLGLFITSQFIFAQLSMDISTSSYLDDNIYNSPYAEQDFLSDYSLYLSYMPKDFSINSYYDGSYTTYNENAVRNYQNHKLGIYYSDPFGKELQNAAYLYIYMDQMVSLLFYSILLNLFTYS